MKIAFFILIILAIIVICHKQEKNLTPIDSPHLPDRGFFMGILPTPGENQTFSEVCAQAAQYCEFVSVWGRPTPFYNLADDLNGEWDGTFVQEYIRNNGMFPIIHLSFFGPGVTLITPPGLEGATLDNPQWRDAYKRAALNCVKVTRPLYLSIGNEVNRWYEKYGAELGNPNSFQHYISLYEEIYDSIKEISPQTIVFCTFAREIVAEYRTANLVVLNIFPTNKLDILVFTSLHTQTKVTTTGYG